MSSYFLSLFSLLFSFSLFSTHVLSDSCSLTAPLTLAMQSFILLVACGTVCFKCIEDPGSHLTLGTDDSSFSSVNTLPGFKETHQWQMLMRPLGQDMFWSVGKTKWNKTWINLALLIFRTAVWLGGVLFVRHFEPTHNAAWLCASRRALLQLSPEVGKVRKGTESLCLWSCLLQSPHPCGFPRRGKRVRMWAQSQLSGFQPGSTTHHCGIFFLGGGGAS